MAKSKEDKLIRIKLRLGHRLIFNTLYPKATDILTGVLIRDMCGKVDLSQEQLKHLDVQPGASPGSLTWKPENNKVTTVAFTGAEMVFLKEQVAAMDKNKKIEGGFLEAAIAIRDAVV